jgi:tyrosine-specific transport protein
MDSKPGNLIGGTLLITGSCVGAGMLGLPILTGLAGFWPSLLMFLVAWCFMTITGLLLVESNGWFARKVNFVSMVEHSLGRKGKILCLITYLFLFYALLVAYISASGNLFSTFVTSGFGWDLPIWVGSAILVFLFGFVVYAGTRQVDLWNRVLMGAKIFFFIALVCIGMPFVNPSLLTYSKPALAVYSVPILLISFGFHNMIPTITSYFHHDLKKVRLAILGGGLMTFVIYLIWEILVLGIVPVEGKNGLIETFHLDREGSQALVAILQSPWIACFAQGLAFFAILTSFLAQALSLVHFLADGMKVGSEKKSNFRLCLLVLVPPLILSLACPKLFFKALNFAGGFCAVLLFGILPALLIWIGRYRKRVEASYQVIGGKPLLVFVLVFASLVFIFQFLNAIEVLSLSKEVMNG